MADKKNILYVGLDRETLYLLCAENDFKVAGVGEIESFQVRNFNPANLVFKGGYFFML